MKQMHRVGARNWASLWQQSKRVSLAAALALVAGGALAVEPLSVSGNKVLAGGQPASFAGNSLFWSNNGWGGEKFYTAEAVAWLKSDWQSTLVRAAMGVEDPGGYLQDPVGNRAKVKAVVDAAIANDMYVIIDWHSHHAEQYQSQAISFFQDMAHTYGNHPNVIYEVYNEPTSQSWSGQIKPYAQAVVNAIRAIDPDNLIVVGTRQWSQRVDEAALDPISGANIAYTLHFYAGTHFDELRGWAQTALNNNAALFVTEWGTVNANGDGAVNHGNTDAWMAFLKQNHISHANWSINDKAEGASALFPGASGTGGWASLTESGIKVRDIIRTWGGGAPPTDCSRVTLPARIQAEKYCAMKGIQRETTTDTGGGENVGYVDAGDWMSYDVTVPSDGQYEVSYRVASNVGGGTIQLERSGGSPVYGTKAVPNTGGWQAWQTLSHTVTLSAGAQRLALSAPQGGWNVNWFEVKAISNPCTGNCPVTTQLEAEHYTAQQGVKLEDTTDTGGGKNVGWLDAGDWMKYQINLPATGQYQVSYRLASAQSGAAFRLETAGGDVLDTVQAPNTGGWQQWQTVTHPVNLAAGQQALTLYVVNGPFNINWLEFASTGNPPTADADGDGVADSLDQCPGTPAGTAVDATGCPVATNSCAGVPAYPNWTTPDYSGGPNTHLEAGEQMQHNTQLYRANWYTNSVPGSDASWSFVKNC
jgi:endoglucanase